MWALIKLQAKTMIKNPASMMMIIMPILFIGIMGTTFGTEKGSMNQIVGNIVTMNMIAVTMMTFGYTLFEMKKSIIMKRIGSTQITKTRAMMAFFAWSSLVGLFTVFWTMVIATIFGATGATDKFIWSNIHWGSFVYGILLGTILSLAIGFFFVSISSNLEVFNMISTMYMMLNMFLGGLFLPGQADWMVYVSYVLPHTWVNGILTAAFQNANAFALGGPIMVDMFSTQIIIDQTTGEARIFDSVDSYQVAQYVISEGYLPVVTMVGLDEFTITVAGEISSELFPQWRAIMNVLMPIASIGILVGVSTKTFKWDS